MNNDLLGIVINAAQKNKRVSADDYIKNGLIYCHKCNTQKQCRVKSMGREFTVPCVCQCESEAMARLESQVKLDEQAKAIKQLKTSGIQDKQITNWTFANDKGFNPKNIDRAKRYVSKWSEMYKKNTGLIFWGERGLGKSYIAACIANALLDMGVPVLVTSFTKIVNALTGFDVKDKNAYVQDFNRYKLLVIDDFGAERSTDTATEIVFNIIDSRYKNGQPIIMTTNIPLRVLKNTSDIKFGRIYDRVLEMCVPIVFEGESIRKIEANQKMQEAKELLK